MSSEPSSTESVAAPTDDRIPVVSGDDKLADGIRAALDRVGYEADLFPTPSALFEALSSEGTPVIVKDHDPGSGDTLEFLERALDVDPFIKVVLVVRPGDEASADAAVRGGAFDYVTRPPDEGPLSRIVHRAILTYTREMAAHRSEAALRREVEHRTAMIKRMTVGTLTALLNAQEARTPLFRGHSQAVAACATGVARTLGLPADQVSSIRTAGLLHDVGMIAVPDSVVNKPGNLDESEFAAIAAHPRRGFEILRPMDHLGNVPRFVLEHHERVDGSGYPDGKRGDEISLGGQIVAIAEYWTAITEDRPFRDRMSAAEAMNTLAGTAGTWFEPELLKALRDWKSGG